MNCLKISVAKSGADDVSAMNKTAERRFVQRKEETGEHPTGEACAQDASSAHSWVPQTCWLLIGRVRLAPVATGRRDFFFFFFNKFTLRHFCNGKDLTQPTVSTSMRILMSFSFNEK